MHRLVILVQIIVVGLAAWRSASLLVNEEGPYNIFGKLREIVGIRPRTQLNELAKIFACVWCMSVWTTLGFWGLWYVSPIIPGIVAAMGLAILAEQWVRPKV